MFRRRFLQELARAHRRGRLEFHGTVAHLANPGEFHATLAAARGRDWVVYAKRPFRGPAQVFRYLARYTHRIAISDSRITAFDGETVSFRHRKLRQTGQKKPRYGTMTVSAHEFIRRFLLHVLPGGMHRIHHFGILANGCRAGTLESARQCQALGAIGCPDERVDEHAPERGMRRRRLKKLWRRLGELQGQSNSRDQLMLKLGAAKKEAGRAWNLVDIRVPETDKELAANGFSFHLRRDRLRRVRRREGRYLLRSNMVAEDPATLWRLYMQLIEIEQAFKELKHDLAIRPIFHQREERIEAHIFVSFIAYCLLVTLKNLARPRASGLTPRAIIEAFATIQMVDVHLPTTDGRHLVLPRHTRPNKEHELLLHQLGMALPQQPAPRICA